MRPLLFPGDLPIIDKPLPRFLDDAAAAKLLRATRADPDPLSRLIVELLARTGIRRGLPRTAVVEAVIAHSDRPHFGKALVAAPVIGSRWGSHRRGCGATTLSTLNVFSS